MSVVIIGGNVQMEDRYRRICQKYNYKAKIFTKINGRFRNQIGHPDMIILFTGTVAHKMLATANREAKKAGIPIFYVNSSGQSALESVLMN